MRGEGTARISRREAHVSTPEDNQSRRGEPVIVTDDRGIEREATIEYGDDRCMSFYCESDGHSTGRIVLYDCKDRVRQDPGGPRPVWDGIMRRSAARKGGEK